METKWNMELPELGDVLRSAKKVQANGGDWYSKDQIEAILGQLVGQPALDADSEYLSLASPRFALALIQASAELHASYERLTAELAEGRKDADRYRWLRHYEAEEHFLVHDTDGYLLELEDLDKAIDTAMEKPK